MASMRNVEGDSWFCVFAPVGAFLKGFVHESKMAPRNNGLGKIWPGVLDEVPEAFNSFVAEPAFSMKETTFCLWRTRTDTAWRKGGISYSDGNDPDGSAQLLSVLDANPDTYRRWAEEYYKCSVNLSLVQQVYVHKPLTEGVVKGLNPKASLAELADDLAEIGYPLSAN